MSELKPKYIIENGELKIGKVTYHIELAYNKSDVAGGGWWALSGDLKSIYFYGVSSEFGGLRKEQILEVIENTDYMSNNGLENVYYGLTAKFDENFKWEKIR